MRSLVAYAWTSLDGIFDANSMDKWFLPFDSRQRRDSISEEINGADALLFGRVTYEMLAPFWSAQKDDQNGPAGKLNSVRKYVVSSTLEKADWNNTTLIGNNVMERISQLKQEDGGKILIEGSATLVQSLLKAGLIDELRLLVHPEIVGTGKRFFKDGMESGTMHLTKSAVLENGVMMLHYQTGKRDQPGK